ncbi:MAG: hypothetical protein EG828_04015 [Deltaproteobacteria bacterium]|nr:hypothetical protein [Deltaproteobacteria bacterium]
MRKIMNLLLVCCMLVFAGCGGGNNGSGGLTGTVRVTGAQSAGDFTSTVSFTISYTNPYVTSVGGVPINYAVWVDGVLIDNEATNFNDNGTNTSSFTVSYTIPKTTTPQSVRCQANSANLISSNVQVVEPLDALDVTPATQEFSATDLVGSTKTYTISGGSGSYSASAGSSPLVNVSVSGSTVIATRMSAAASTTPVSITVTDTVTLDTVIVQATLVAIPPAPAGE